MPRLSDGRPGHTAFKQWSPTTLECCPLAGATLYSCRTRELFGGRPDEECDHVSRNRRLFHWQQEMKCCTYASLFH